MTSDPVCFDCKRPYSEHGVDTLLSTDQWRLICGENEKEIILCATCIMKRAHSKAGVISTRAILLTREDYKDYTTHSDRSLTEKFNAILFIINLLNLPALTNLLQPELEKLTREACRRGIKLLIDTNGSVNDNQQNHN